MSPTKKKEKKERGIGLHGFMVVLSLIMIMPFMWMVLTSLKTLAEVGDPDWLPASFQWENYLEVFQVIPFMRFMSNTAGDYECDGGV